MREKKEAVNFKQSIDPSGTQSEMIRSSLSPVKMSKS